MRHKTKKRQNSKAVDSFFLKILCELQMAKIPKQKNDSLLDSFKPLDYKRGERNSAMILNDTNFMT